MTPYNAKLSDSEVRAEIRLDFHEAEGLRRELEYYTCAAIADRHGVTEEAIKQYKQRRTYKKDF